MWEEGVGEDVKGLVEEGLGRLVEEGLRGLVD
jgi:hypothetical protein